MSDAEEMVRWRAQAGLNYLEPEHKRHLVRLTAAHDAGADEVSWQAIVLDDADEDELEEYSCIATEVLADFQTATMREETIRIDKAEDARHVRPLAITIFDEKAP